MMKRKYAVALVLGIGLVIAATVFMSLRFSNKHLGQPAPSNPCKGIPGSTRIIRIENDQMVPQHTNGKLCDKLTIVNSDDVIRVMAFGAHSEHQAYDGVSETTLGKNQSFSVTLVNAGTFIVHDHIHDEVQGDFIVSP